MLTDTKDKLTDQLIDGQIEGQLRRRKHENKPADSQTIGHAVNRQASK